MLSGACRAACYLRAEQNINADFGCVKAADQQYEELWSRDADRAEKLVTFVDPCNLC